MCITGTKISYHISQASNHYINTTLGNDYTVHSHGLPRMKDYILCMCTKIIVKYQYNISSYKTPVSIWEQTVLIGKVTSNFSALSSQQISTDRYFMLKVHNKKIKSHSVVHNQWVGFYHIPIITPVNLIKSLS